MKEQKICRDCGEIIEHNDYLMIDGEYLCRDCYEQNYFTCEDCGEVVNNDYLYWVEDKCICQDCIDYNYFLCNDCGEYHHTDNLNYVEVRDYDICDNCRDWGDYYYCSDCGDLFHIDDLNYSNREDSYYCDRCFDDHNDGLLCYHGIDDFIFFKNNDEIEPREYIGAEIEVEPKSYADVNGVLNAIRKNNINAEGEEDSSLDYGGVEIVTHPETWEYKLSHKQNYINLFEDLKNLNYGDDGSAGLHFHVSRPNDDIITRIIVILESFKNEIKKLSRRGGNFGWSKFLTDYYSTNEDKYKYQSTKYLKENYVKHSHDRYLALNLNNTNTIEFRFFNGANNFEEFWGALQFIHNIMDVAYSDKELNTIKWKDLLQGEELINQAIKLDVYNVDKYAKDTTEIYEKMEIVKEQTKEEIKRTLKNFIKYINRQMAKANIEGIKSNDIDTIEKDSRRFINNLATELDFLSSVINTYKSIETTSIESLKFQMTWLKKSAEERGKKYGRYFDLTEKSIKKYESEVIA